ncbi:hypothetical protein [Micromonospora sp. NPDC005652]|uniref:hypothetical protein n=1 Tax=Micromonospora sp. NPDC005652 TaxID=3157046 RepID=UPI0033DE6A1C
MPNLSLAQIRNRLILSARMIMTDHWPGEDGSCPLCRYPACLAMAGARAYLDSVGDPYVPTKARRAPGGAQGNPAG